MCLAAFTYRSSIFTAHDCQRQHLANKVTKVSEQGWAGGGGGKKKIWQAHTQYLKEPVLEGGEREKADEESVMDKVKVQKKKGNRERGERNKTKENDTTKERWRAINK